VVLANAFDRPAIAVDTHVGRLARRLRFSAHENPDKVEADLEKLFPEERWIFLHHALILHGRRICHARKPECEVCSLADVCPSSRV
jgi:endonuclease-3